jgi:PAS domain S-box-containing protein
MLLRPIWRWTLRERGLFGILFDAVAMGIAIETLEGQPLFANPALCSMLGFSEEELCRKHCVEFSPPEDAEKDWSLFQQLRQGSIDNYHLEKRFFRKDGTLIWGRLSIALMKDSASPSPLVVAMVQDITDKRAAEEKLQRSEANLQLLTGRLIQAQEEERQRIAGELHDDIAQRLSLLVLGLEELSGSMATGRNGQSVLASELHRKSEEVAMDVQKLSHNLHSPKLHYLGLRFALRQLSDKISRHYHIEINLHCAELPANLPSDLELCIYRVAQGAVSNAAKHSHATEIFVELTYRDETLLLKVADSGVGFDPSASHQGIGLTIMRERIRMFGGELFVESMEGKGTTIIAKAKLEKAKGMST